MVHDIIFTHINTKRLSNFWLNPHNKVWKESNKENVIKHKQIIWELPCLPKSCNQKYVYFVGIPNETCG